MIKYLQHLLLTLIITTDISWSANNSNYFPLQVGNTWKYFWGYELPECCRSHSDTPNQCFFECIVEGAVTIHKVEDSFINNNRTYFVYVIYEATFVEEYRILQKDTLSVINNCIYKSSGTEHHLWLNFNNPESLYTFQTQPEDTFSIQYFNRQYGTYPIHSALFNIKNKLTADSLFVINRKVFGQYYKIDYTKADSNDACWIENYWPGIGLVYSSLPNKARYIVLQSAIIDGDSIKVGIKQNLYQPGFVKKSISTDDHIFDIRGNLVRYSNIYQRNATTPAGIYVTQSGTKLVQMRHIK